MYKYVKSKNIMHVSLEIICNYSLDNIQQDIATSEQLDSMDISSLDKKIINFVKGEPIDVNSEAYKNFIDFVDSVDELLELREYEIVGESEEDVSNYESKYRGVVMNIVKNVNGIHISGKIENALRLSAHPESRQSRRNRRQKMEKSAESDEARKLNNGQPLIVGDFESIVVKCSVDSPEGANYENKEFYSYADALRCVDYILNKWDVKAKSYSN